jgi:hypothetical protein
MRSAGRTKSSSLDNVFYSKGPKPTSVSILTPATQKPQQAYQLFDGKGNVIGYLVKTGSAKYGFNIYGSNGELWGNVETDSVNKNGFRVCLDSDEGKIFYYTCGLVRGLEVKNTFGFIKIDDISKKNAAFTVYDKKGDAYLSGKFGKEIKAYVEPSFLNEDRSKIVSVQE